MGYNNRALRLRDAVRTIHKEYAGVFPRELPALLRIKGIGPYTAAAIRNFAWNLPTPCIDTNIRRILHRTFIGPEEPNGTWKVGDRELLKLAEEVLAVALDQSSTPSLSSTLRLRSRQAGGGGTRMGEDLPLSSGEGVGGRGRDTANWHAALMDFGSLIQTKNHPKWEMCPLTQKGLMKTTPRSFARMHSHSKLITQNSKLIQEPGRFVGSRFIPNRIFRGRIIEALRDASTGRTLREIGRHICMDWDAEEHKDWLLSLINKLMQEGLIEQRRSHYMLAGSRETCSVP